MLIGLIILVVLVIAVVVMYNGFIRLKNQCDEAFATMDVYLKKRYDLIPNLVETVKGYAAHEKETLQGVIEARNMAAGAATLEEKAAGEKALAGNLRGLFAIAENYPDLKANTNFLDLQNQLKVIEDDIANSRKYFNAVVREFNIKCEAFPTNLIASAFNFEKKTMFEVESDVERENVKVSF